MSRAFVQFCADLSAAPDRDAFDTTLAAVWRAAAGTTRAGWARAATDSLAPLLRSAPLPTATRIAGLCGAIVAAGGTPTPIAGPLLARGFDTLRLGRRFHDAWTGTGDDPAPNPEHQSPSPGLQARLEPRLGHETEWAVQSWWTLASWIGAVNSLLASSAAARSAVVRRTSWLDHTTALGEVREVADLVTLLSILDGEELIVLHRATGRGYAVTVSGLTDNFQLHTLLADALVGDPAAGYLDGTPPDPRWVAASRDGRADEVPVSARFNLVDAHGAWIWNEGTPADIPLVADRRVVVLDPLPYPRTWTNQRLPVRASVQLTRRLPAAEAARWLGRVTGAVG